MIKVHSPAFRILLPVFLFLNLIGAQILHETGHWAVLQLYGRRPLWGISSMIQLWERDPRVPDDWVQFTDIDGDQGWLYMETAPESDTEMLLFILAGPLIQVLAVAVGLVVLFRAASTPVRTWALLFLMVNAFSQAFYQSISLLRGSGGDEKLIGYYLGISPSIPKLIFGIFHLVVLFWAFRSLGSRSIRWAWGLALFIGGVIVGPLIMLLNQWIIVQVDAGEVWGLGIFGFTLPVILIGTLSILGLWALNPQVKTAETIALTL